MPLTWIGVDLDGTLAVGACPGIGRPVERMCARVREWLTDGVDVRIVTARVNDASDLAAEQRARIEAWCVEHLGRVLPITAEKDYAMALLYDDRAVQVVTDTGELVQRAEDHPLEQRDRHVAHLLACYRQATLTHGTGPNLEAEAWLARTLDGVLALIPESLAAHAALVALDGQTPEAP